MKILVLSLVLNCFSPLFSMSIQAREKSNNKTKKDSDVHTSMNAPKSRQKEFEEKDFKPHMVNHFNEGCPANSECNPKMGRLYKEWNELLSKVSSKKLGYQELEAFRKKFGLPFEIWTTEQVSADEDIIFWDSPCRQHNKEDEPKIRIGLAMASNLNSLKTLSDEGKVLLRFLKLYRGDKKEPKNFLTLRGETPLYIDGDKLIYQRLSEGSYYGLSIDPRGRLHVLPTKIPPEYPQSIDCPESMVEFIKKEKLPKNLYDGVYCQKTWNMAKKDFDILMVGWSCN